LTAGDRWTAAWNRTENSSPNPTTGETMTVLLLKHQHQDWMMKEQHQNYQAWNSIVPAPGIFFSLSLSACLDHCLLVYHLSLWISLDNNCFSFSFFLSFFLFSFFLIPSKCLSSSLFVTPPSSPVDFFGSLFFSFSLFPSWLH
jgi:hypothetical protein